MGKDRKDKESQQDDPEKDTTGISFVEEEAIFSETNENLEWERPFADTGRGTLPILTPAEHKIHNPVYDPSQMGWRNAFTSARVHYLIAGGLAGAGARILTHPFDRARTAMQLSTPKDPRFLNIVTTFRTFLDQQGKRSFFRGLDISLLRIMPEIALKFAIYEEVKKWFVANRTKKAGKQATFQERFLAGAAAGFVSHMATYPIWVVQTRLAAQRPPGSEFSGIRDAFRKIYLNEGPRSFYRGLLVSLTVMAPAMGLDLAIYGRLKKLYKNYFRKHGHPPAYALLLCGTVSSCLAHLIIYPLLLPRIRLQAKDPHAMQIQTTEKNLLGYLVDLYKKDGLRKGLYRGLTPSLIKVVPAVSISYVLYEKINWYLKQFQTTEKSTNKSTHG
ncbi:hypothetical protein RvY_16450 [Ramazzottius varieornatus]|uniref:Uncharacterized protein n=1 Tax=Ramazzottius varieornatus TaxID=947166 RepID=A0A1D1VZT9_RAMVA|nr:hypothetical protein RvY_16450 [Ramazzottius varieornatus]